ncbi:uncharacterized protein LOC125000541 isoform X1 [Mugil cephalus]|uniref:uncharacterized protein LOC125000541 isoform X1 n=1 Tax=Mugil cephalus TaxID=48193 RepID=UPI001FB648C6|nr:uncharacterized protein LOC125000541 isoform X1 [Mugil cephalus]
MDGLWIILVALSGVVSSSHGWIPVPTLKVTVRPGDNVTLYCDCRQSGVYTAWFRNCSHENQPTLVLSLIDPKLWTSAGLVLRPRFEFVKNNSTDSYDLLITNVTDSDEGLYYCGTEKPVVEDKEYITTRHVYTYGNITTKLILDSRDPCPHTTPSDCSMCCMLLYSLCPVCAGVSSFLSSLLVYHFCRKRAKDHQVDEQNADSGQTRLNQGEDVCYAALEIRRPSQRPKNKRQSSDFSTYSAVNTSRRSCFLQSWLDFCTNTGGDSQTWRQHHSLL